MCCVGSAISWAPVIKPGIFSFRPENTAPDNPHRKNAVHKNHLYGHLLAFSAILIWGTTLVSTKVLLRHFSPEEIIVYRFALAYGLLLLLCREQVGWAGWRNELLFCGLGVTGVTLYFWTENAALKYTLSANVGMIVSAIPILTAMLAHYTTHDEKFRPTLLVGFLVAMAGIGLIIYNGQQLALNPLGDILALGSALFFTIYNILIRKAPKGYGRIVMVRKTFFWGWAASLPIWLLTGGKFAPLADFNFEALANLAYLATFASVLGYVMWNKAIEIIGAVPTSNYIYLMPLFTMVAGVVVLDERITPLMLAGGALILLGVYVNEHQRFRLARAN